MGRARFLLALVVVASSTASLVAAPASIAQEASLGTVSLDTPSLTWTGPFDGPQIDETHDFDLKVDVPEAYWDVHDLLLEIRWQDRTNNFDLYLLKSDGTLLEQESHVDTDYERIVVPRLDPGEYIVRVYSFAVATPRSDGSAYEGLVSLQPLPRSEVVFDDSNRVEFAPATVVSANFLGSEPQMSLERPVAGSDPNRIDPDRVFVDWPLTTRSQIGQISRSVDGGDSFRLLFDPSCAARSRPTCQSGGGGDTDTVVSPFDGDLFFSDQQGGSAHEALASSTDHGDTFPATRQHSITNTSFVTDRQWLTHSHRGDDALHVGGRRIEAFLSTRVVGVGMYLQGIDQDGAPIPQPVPQLRTLGANGPPRVVTSGVAKGWLLMPYDESTVDEEAGVDIRRLRIATVHGSDYQDPAAWRSVTVAPDEAILFPWLDVDSAGNAYLVWAAEDGGETAIFFSSSPIEHPDNDPSTGRPGTYWTPQARVSLPSVGSAVFPAITAGDPGRVAITYMGTEDHHGLPGDVPFPFTAEWHTYGAVMTNALAVDGPPVASTGLVSHRLAHQGQICTDGLDCDINGTDRSLLDLMDIGHDEQGRAAVVFMDNHSTFARPEGAAISGFPFVHFAKQVSGPSLRADEPEVNITIPESSRPDPTGDATWPNTGGGRPLPSLDLETASLTLEDGNLVARLPLVTTSSELMKLDLASYNASPSTNPPAERLQYVLRFANEDDVFHLSMEHLTNGSRSFFGGKLDTNDGLDNGFDVFGAGYHRDDLPVTGTVTNEHLEIRAPASSFGIGAGDRLFSVTGFSMAGPSETTEEAIFHIMRTIDATPPYDMTLLEAPEPTPTPTLTPGATPTPTVSASPTVTPGPDDSTVTVSPAESTGSPGSAQEIVARLTDGAGEPVAGSRVTWSSVGVGSLDRTETVTDADGRAVVLLGSDDVGDQTVTATVDDCEGSCVANALRHWGPSSCDVFGTAESDLLYGGADSEVVCAFGGNDTVVITEGAHVVKGAGGNDRLFGAAEIDILNGGKGDDELRGRGGADELRGGGGDDLLWGGRGRDYVRSGRGHDRVTGGPGRDRCKRGRRDRSSGCER